jgi:hypothetical protein
MWYYEIGAEGVIFARRARGCSSGLSSRGVTSRGAYRLALRGRMQGVACMSGQGWGGMGLEACSVHF